MTSSRSGPELPVASTALLRHLGSGQRAAATMSQLQSAKLNGLDPYVGLRTNVLERLPTHRASGIEEWCRLAGNRRRS